MTGEGPVLGSDREEQGDSGLFLGAESHVISEAWKVWRRKEEPGAITAVVVFGNWRR